MVCFKGARRALLVAVLGLGIAGVGLYVGGLAGVSAVRAEDKTEKTDKDKPDAKERHPRIHAALRALKDAKEDLEKADHDFGGHRAEAVKAVQHAINQLGKALEFDKP